MLLGVAFHGACHVLLVLPLLVRSDVVEETSDLSTGGDHVRDADLPQRGPDLGGSNTRSPRLTMAPAAGGAAMVTGEACM